jgi:site-specific recombinase XerD
MTGPAESVRPRPARRGRIVALRPARAGDRSQAELEAAAAAAGVALRPHWLRHTYGTRLRQGGADPAQIQALMGHASIDTTARYFRAGAAEVAGVVDRILEP